MKKNEQSTQIEKFWEEYEVNPDKPLFWKIGSLQMWCIRDRNEIKIATKHDQEILKKEPDGEKDLPESIVWNRWAVKQDRIKIRLKPVFPDRPVVIKPEAPFRIIPGAQAKVYVRIPIWIQILLSGKRPLALAEYPSVILSNTWFGSFMEGELCYWISTGARRQFSPDASRPYQTICPVVAINKSNEELLVEKFRFQVSHLTLYFDGIQLWSDETRVSYQGDDQFSQISVAGSAPQESGSSKLITSPRQTIKKSLAAKTFSAIKELPGLGLFSN